MPTRTFSSTFVNWIADAHSIMLHGGGAQIDFTTFVDAKFGTAGTRKIPSGTVCGLNVSGRAIPWTTGVALLLRSDAYEDSPTAAISGYGFVTGGNVYEAVLPDAAGTPKVLTAPQKAALGVRFYFQ